VATGWVALDAYPNAVAQLDVAIAPLADNAFNAGKSWLKPLEAAAFGVPCVMSPSPEYRRLHDDYGIGILTETPSDWETWVRRLARDSVLRKEKAEHDRQMVREHLTIEQHAWRWQEAWAQALQNARQRKSELVSA
jgi:glycosyltransferase involved in cell wall biosynthesis